MFGIRYFDEQHTRTVTLVIFAGVICKLIFGKCNRRCICHCTWVDFHWNGFELNRKREHLPNIKRLLREKKHSNLIDNYQGFRLIVTLRLQENINRCSCRLIRNMLIKVAQKFYGQEIVMVLIIFDWFQSLEKCIPIEWPLLTLSDLSFC